MSLSFNFLYTKFFNTYQSVTKRMGIEEYRELVAIGYLNDSEKLVDDILYFDTYQDLGDWHNDVEICVVTTVERAHLFPKCNLIVLQSKSELSMAPAFANRIFIRMAEWERDIYRVLAANESPQKIIDVTAELVGSPMYIADTSFKMIARWGDELGEANPTWRYQVKYSYLPYNVTESLIETGDLELLYKKKKAWIVSGMQAFPSLPFVSKSIQRDGEHYGNFFIIEFYRHLDDCDVEIADKLGDMLSLSMIGNKNYLEASSMYHSHFLEEIIEGTVEDDQIVRDQLKALGWRPEGEYFLAMFNTSEDDVAICNHLMMMITTNLESQCLIYKGFVLAVINYEKSGFGKCLEQLDGLQHDFNRSVGVSEIYGNFFDTATYYEQAAFALSIRPTEGKSKRIMYTCNFAIDLVKRIKRKVPKYYAVQRLKHYDDQHGTELCDTLLTWLANDRNTAATADKMFLHRNTLMNRIKRIEEVMDVDLNDMNVRLRVVLALYGLVEDKMPS